MAQASTLNIRLLDSLKTHGNQVLEREGISASEAVRKLYEYLEREQKMPDCLMQKAEQDKYELRRRALKEFAQMTCAKSAWRERGSCNESLFRYQRRHRHRRQNRLVFGFVRIIRHRPHAQVRHVYYSGVHNRYRVRAP